MALTVKQDVRVPTSLCELVVDLEVIRCSSVLYLIDLMDGRVLPDNHITQHARTAWAWILVA
jgi:hypothetical protein